MEPETYAAFLRQHRGDRAQGAVADACAAMNGAVKGLNQSAISLIERGALVPTGEQADALAEALGLPPEERERGRALLRRQHLDRLHLAEETP